MAIYQTKTYKHQYLINIAENRIWPADDLPPARLLSIPFLNPHEIHVITSPVSADSPYFSAYKYGLSKHPHDRAVEMLTNNPQLVDLLGLIRNPNPNIAPLLEQYLEQFNTFDWIEMCQSNNKAILEFMEKHTDKISWPHLSGNKHEIAIRILQNNPHNIYFEVLSGNPSGIEIMKQHMDMINWEVICINPHPDAIKIIEQNLDRVLIDKNWNGIPWTMHYYGLSQNPNAFHILLENPRFIHFGNLLNNTSEIALAYIEANATQINNSNIGYLIGNPNGLMLIEKLLKQGRIRENTVMKFYYELVMNPSFFDVDLDYQELSKKRSKIIYSELTEKAFHPSRVSKWLDYHCDNGGTPDDFEM